ncbi:type II toxin-antitoxin system RelE/ParE family toxin [Fischerella thermalis]|uniref:type II toxin-antitoxin system RelE/ParE family toxin n=1 Tax=Fischerella thermalis TaxID=372787 RepID=UPI000C80E8C1|nr:type II toxin-antitoxin system RelE/ParE family toxin [Fischerella thermalis]MBF1988162.1 type II toxin-antitoxin system RelE/ParE family toxin [Fischerella thermalis M58_A2018_009]MBF2061134.1 type II toxin-antitoxin system RelE/ParE family toxin [Fischerella thermalis M66_A2018_004]MBF2068071.1 type II toxin-antitoxin system RelE/ParE family toxin [Fischerella thermalis M48_A2018_028]PLZ86210.1 plasmid stabilization protein [Fischerella thermalis CCMEE 5194]
MNCYRLSQQAGQDLEDIWIYLAQQDELAADKQIAQLLDCLPMLAQFPDMGRKRDDLLQRLRSFPVKPYIVFYTKITDGIEIVRVLHQSRDDIENYFS